MAQPPHADWCWHGVRFCDLYGDSCNFGAAFAIAHPRGLGPSPMSPVPSPVFGSESTVEYQWDRAGVGVVRRTNEDGSVRDIPGCGFGTDAAFPLIPQTV